jgi:hypothetical protein
MRWSWPAWAAVVLGLLAAIWGFVARNGADQLVAPNALLGGLILLGLGLMSLQRSYDACCSDYCGYGGGCDCGHCEGCKGDACCGECKCCDDDEGGHEHGKGGKHSH